MLRTDKRERTEAGWMAEVHAGCEGTRKFECQIAGHQHLAQKIVSSSMWHRQALTLSVTSAQKHGMKNFIAGLLFPGVIPAMIQNK